MTTAQFLMALRLQMAYVLDVHVSGVTVTSHGATEGWWKWSPPPPMPPPSPPPPSPPPFPPPSPPPPTLPAGRRLDAAGRRLDAEAEAQPDAKVGAAGATDKAAAAKNATKEAASTKPAKPAKAVKPAKAAKPAKTAKPKPKGRPIEDEAQTFSDEAAEEELAEAEKTVKSIPA